MFKTILPILLLSSLSLVYGSVLKTGQTKSYDADGNVVTDGSIKDDGYYQTGKARSYSRSSAGIVKDNATGLEWQDDVDSVSRNWEDAKAYCSNLPLDGGGWRLPTIEELETLVDDGLYAPSVTSEVFQHISSEFYWSSTVNVGYSSNAWSVDFDTGYSEQYGKNFSYYVRCVRGDQLPSSNFSRDDTNKIVVDATTHLVWQDDYSDNGGNIKSANWIDAINYCEDLVLGGYSDWRLPNRKEMFSIADRSRYNPAIDNTIFVNTASERYWSSTTLKSTNTYAWLVYYNYGGSDYYTKNTNYYVRCVRGGQLDDFPPIVIKPKAIDHTYDTGVATSVSGNILTDHNAGYSAGDSSVRVEIESTVAHGQLSYDVDSGHFDYTPDDNYVGLDSFYYKVMTAEGTSERAKVTFNIGFSTDNTPPHVTISASSRAFDVDDNISFSASAGDDGAIATYAWDFGDGTHGDSPYPSHIYSAPGIYGVSCTVTDEKGAHAQDKMLVFVSSPEDDALGIDGNRYNMVNTKGVANAFSLFADLSKDGLAASGVCDNYDFKVVDAAGGELINNDCATVEDNDTAANAQRYRIDFNANHVIENAFIEICEKGTAKCGKLNNLSHINIYGTSFDMRKDAFAFENGSWTVIETSNSLSSPNVNFINQVGKDAGIIADYLRPKDIFYFYKSVGYLKRVLGFPVEKTELGLCYGMAIASMANYNHKTEKDFWSIGDDFKTAIDEHWNKDLKSVNFPYKPFSGPTANMKADTDTVRKLMYYFVGQNRFFDNNYSNWVGKQALWAKTGNVFAALWINEADHVNELKAILKNGKVTHLRFDVYKDGEKQYGHAVVLVQLIEFNGQKRWIVYDNNYPYGADLRQSAPFLMYDELHYGKIGKSDGKFRGSTYELKDVYSESVSENPDPATYEGPDSMHALRSAQRNVESVAPTVDVVDPSYVQILLVGGDVSTLQNGEFSNIALIENGELDGTQSVSIHSSFLTTLYLPVGEHYIIHAQKYAAYPNLEIFERIPQPDGKVKLVNFNDVQYDEKDRTRVVFHIGDDSNQTIAREAVDVAANGSAIVGPAYEQNLTYSIPAPKHFQGMTQGADAWLIWDNDSYRTCIIRKASTPPTSYQDGELLYCDDGIGVNYHEGPLNSQTVYYYSAYNFDGNGHASKASTISLDTGKWSLTGDTYLDDVSMTVTNAKGEVVGQTRTHESGSFAIGNLPEGNYTVRPAKDTYAFTPEKVDFRVESANCQVDFTPRQIPTLRFLTPMTKVYIGDENTTIRWSFRHIDPSEKVWIEYTDDSMPGAAMLLGHTDINGSFQFSAGSTIAYNAKLKIVLDGNESVFDTLTFDIVSPQSEFIVGLYADVNDTQPDQDAINQWMQILQDESAAYVVLSFINTTAFANSAPTDNNEYIDFIYKMILNRIATIDEKTYWVNALNDSKTREDLTYALLKSSEFRKCAESLGVTALRQSDLPPRYKDGINPAIIHYLLF